MTTVYMIKKAVLCGGNQSSERLSDLAKIIQWVNYWCNDLNPHCLTPHLLRLKWRGELESAFYWESEG